MPGKDRRIDPATGDYISDGAGGFEYTETLETAMYHQLKGRYGEWYGDPEAGSLIHLLPQESLDATTVALATTFVEQALQRFVDRGEARDLVALAEVDPDNPNRLLLGGSIVDLQAGPIDLADLIGGD